MDRSGPHQHTDSLRSLPPNAMEAAKPGRTANARRPGRAIQVAFLGRPGQTVTARSADPVGLATRRSSAAGQPEGSMRRVNEIILAIAAAGLVAVAMLIGIPTHSA